MPVKPGAIPRRALLKGALLTGVASAVLPAEAQQPEQPAADAVTAAEVAAATRLTGRSYPEPQRELMARRLTRTRATLRALRDAALPAETEPALEFDPRLPGVRLPRGESSAQPSSGPAPRYSGKTEDLAFASVLELSRLVKSRKVTSRELTRMYLERLKRHGPRLFCVVTLAEDLALKQAERADRDLRSGRYRGPLHGIPWGAKDLLATKGIRTTWGAKPYEHQVLDHDAAVVRRLEHAGAVLVAKLTLGELAQGDVWFGGRTRSPWRPDQGSSGSSAGPGSATAAGLVGFAIGSETLGSIVSPSVVNGVTGLRPTYGRVPRTGAMTLCWTMDKLGPMCRTVEDCALVLAAIHGPDGEDGTVAEIPFRWNPRSSLRSLRVGIDEAAFKTVERDEKLGPVYAEVLKTLSDIGVRLRPVTLPPRNPAYDAVAGTIIAVESAASFAKLTESGQLELLERQNEGAWPNTFRVGSTIPAVDYLQALRVRRQLQREMAKTFEEHDLYVTVPHAGPSLAYTNLTGHPSLITRCGMVDGLPQSIEFIGNLYREDAILRVALAYEQATGWHGQWPAIP